MGRLGDLLSSVATRWALGVAVALALGVQLLLFGTLFSGLIALIAYAFGAPDAALTNWLVLSAIAWVPLAVGIAFPAMLEVFGPRVAARRDTERQAKRDRYSA